MNGLNRRRALRGMLNGSAVTVALPLLNCFLNGNGTALADGAKIPIRFGTWFWGLGMNKSIFVPKKVGAGYDIPEEMEPLRNVSHLINVFTNHNAIGDGNAENIDHYGGLVIARTGISPANRNDRPGETIDVTIANEIGRTTRFKLLTAAATGDVRTLISYENASSINAPEIAPISLYTKLFGPDFQDPNASSFKPNPRVMVRKSALSGLIDDIKDFNNEIGAEDKARMDEYFTGLRHLERQFDQQLIKPEPIAICHPAAAPKEDPSNANDTEHTKVRHRMLTDLMVMAVACDQSRVFNMAYSSAAANTTKAGYEKPHHTCTHEEPVDDKLGYQPTASWFTRRAFDEWAYFVEAFSKIKEGDGTLLDNMFIMATSDHGWARVHERTGHTMFSAGRAGGKAKTGLHVPSKGGSVTQLGFTAMKIMGHDIPSWGARNSQTSEVIGEIVS